MYGQCSTFQAMLAHKHGFEKARKIQLYKMTRYEISINNATRVIFIKNMCETGNNMTTFETEGECLNRSRAI